MANVNSFLGCMSLETGARIIGLITAIISFAFAVSAYVLIFRVDEFLALFEVEIQQGKLTLEFTKLYVENIGGEN